MNNNVFIEREFEFEDQIQKGTFWIRIYLPISLGSPQDDWVCKFEITLPGYVENGNVFGVDGVQAFLLAIKKISSTLSYYREKKVIKIQWLGMDMLGLDEV